MASDENRACAPAPGTILVVEDNEEIREALEGLIKEEGYGVLLAGDGEEALEGLEHWATPDLIVLDLNMPRMSGFELVQRLRRHEVWRNIPVLVCSALPQRTVAAVPATAHLSKPIDVGAFLTFVAQYCGVGGRRRSARAS